MSSILFLGNVRVLLGVHTSQLKTYTLFKADFNIFSAGFSISVALLLLEHSTDFTHKVQMTSYEKYFSPTASGNKLNILCSSGGFFFK